MITFMISDSLEAMWGEFKTTLFCYVGIIGSICATLVVPHTAVMIGYLFYESAFFAFATLYPRVEFRLFFILPVQVRFLAMLGAVLVVWPGFSSASWWGVLALVFANYLIWAGIPALRRKSGVVKAISRRKQFKSGQASAEGNCLYRCAVCERTTPAIPISSSGSARMAGTIARSTCRIDSSISRCGTPVAGHLHQIADRAEVRHEEPFVGAGGVAIGHAG